MSSRFLVCGALLFGFESGFAVETAFQTPLILNARSGAPSSWQYTVEDPGSGWSDSAFNDSGWQSGPGGFGTGTPQDGLIATAWSTRNIWLRKHFTVPDIPFQSLILSLYHDEDVEIYLNGHAVFLETGYVLNYFEPFVSESFLAALKPGENVLAIMCTNTDGAGYIDAGLALGSNYEATALVSDYRESAPTQWKYTSTDPGSDWDEASFDASAWTTGPAAFGSPEYSVATPWMDSAIWMRTTFELASTYSHYGISFAYDDDMEVYLNGTQVFQGKGWDVVYKNVVSAKIGQAIHTGANTLAVHCRNPQGAQFIDVGLWGLEKSVSSVMRRSASAASRVPSPVLWAGPQGVDIAALPGRGRLSVFGSDGRVQAVVSGESAAGHLPLRVTLGTGVFRYRWDSPQGSRQGKLLRLP